MCPSFFPAIDGKSAVLTRFLPTAPASINAASISRSSAPINDMAMSWTSPLSAAAEELLGRFLALDKWGFHQWKMVINGD